jgi:hypothetical protein
MESLAARFIGLSAEGALKKGTGSELKGEIPAKDGGREVPVPLFQRGLNERRLADFVSPVHWAPATGHEPRQRG